MEQRVRAHEEVPRESVVGHSRVSIMSRPSQQHTNGASRPPRGAESRLPGTSHKPRKRGKKRDLEEVGGNERCKKSCTSNGTSEVTITTPGNSDLPAVASNSSSEGSSSEVESASASSAIQDHSYSLVNELMPLESADGDLRVTEHSYSLASIGALEAPPTQQVPSTLRRSSRRSARLLSTARRRSRALPSDSSPEPTSVANPTREYSRVEERSATGGSIQDVVEAESSLETETGRTNPVHPAEPPALIAMTDGAEHLAESRLNSSLDFIRSRSRDREARQGRERSSSQRRSARVANTRRMHTTRRQSPPNLPLPPLPHVLPLPRTATAAHPLLYAHVPLNLQLLRHPQVNSLPNALPTLVPSPPNLEPLSAQPASNVLSRTSAEGTGVAPDETAVGQSSDQANDEIQMWTGDSFENPIHSRQHHLRRSSRDLPHLHRRARRNAEPSILNDISEADLRSLHSRAPQSVDTDLISRDSPGLERWSRQHSAATSASADGASTPIDVVVVDSDSEEDADQDVIIISDERPVTVENSDQTGSRPAAANSDIGGTSRVTGYALLDSVPRDHRWRFMEMGLVESNQFIHFYGDGDHRSEGRGSSRDMERRARTLLINATPSVVPRVAEEEEIDSEIVLEVPPFFDPRMRSRVLQSHIVRRPNRYPPPPIMWYPTLESRFHTFEELLDLADDLGPARLHGLTQDEIDKLNMRCFGDWDSDSSIDSKCVVCLSEYKCPEKVRTLQCSHVFHQACIDQWLLGHRTCPICRIDVRPS